MVVKRQFTNAPSMPPVNGVIFKKPFKPNYVGTVSFGVSASTMLFFIAAVVHEKEKETLWQRLRKRTDGPKWSTIRDLITDDKLFQADLWQEQKKMWLEKKQALLDDLRDKLEKFNSIPIEVRRVFLTVAQTYLSLSDAEKTMTGLIGVNLLVFCAWRIPALKPVMNRYFTHNPGSGQYLTLITSCFSHRDLLHLTMNMVALWSFGPLIHDVLGREQFVAAYLSVGINANVISHVVSLALRQSRPLNSSLGASGAIYGLISATAYTNPNSSVFVPFLPTVPININYAVPTLLSLDVAGILMRWRMFDHFAHLGGATLGLAYMQFGPNYVWPWMLNAVRKIKRNGKGNGGEDDNSGVLMKIPERLRSKFLKKKVAVPEE
ncbi:hypothetical protein INT47_009129 [Mucor saturninus]|uniref:Peptidase S54 rhomboid domain-containing protein n=1 Tax=Mucor saturninus TaxID=64648 RepID=A0A8H7VAN2_9FUNG|nr:hypothetical protein INT47_009129 [Mucor saturninus]